MDSEVRSMTTDLLNLSEEFRFDPVKEIVKGIQKVKKEEKQPTPVIRSKAIRKLDIIFEPVSKLLGFNVVGIWGFIIFLNIAVWFCYFRSVGMSWKGWKNYAKEAKKSPCLVPMYEAVTDVGRPKFDCRKCIGLTEVKPVKNLTHQEFLTHYAYTGVPVLVKGGVKHWKAVKTFSYDWFRDLYQKYDAFKVQEEDGQFFPYKTKFETLEEALNMSPKRRNKTWYFGWNNVHVDVARVLREQYSRPHFLPPKAESSQIDWIFMGKPGKGAQMHIDSVARPSWQAQVKGKKTWELVPSAECQHVCKPINGTMEKGDIIVVDTNQWYHATHIWPGEISITIGSEYD